jgi:hypothetical protein
MRFAKGLRSLLAIAWTCWALVIESPWRSALAASTCRNGSSRRKKALLAPQHKRLTRLPTGQGDRPGESLLNPLLRREASNLEGRLEFRIRPPACHNRREKRGLRRREWPRAALAFLRSYRPSRTTIYANSRENVRNLSSRNPGSMFHMEQI